jgi:ATP-dependent RNA helicase DOB1
MASPLRVMQEIARHIAKISKESKLPVVEDEYVSSFKVELMDAVMQWCRGSSFAEICKVCRIATIMTICRSPRDSSPI